MTDLINLLTVVTPSVVASSVVARRVDDRLTLQGADTSLQGKTPPAGPPGIRFSRARLLFWRFYVGWVWQTGSPLVMILPCLDFSKTRSFRSIFNVMRVVKIASLNFVFQSTVVSADEALPDHSLHVMCFGIVYRSVNSTTRAKIK